MARAVGFEPTIPVLETGAFDQAKLHPHGMGDGAAEWKSPAKRPGSGPEDSPDRHLAPVIPWSPPPCDPFTACAGAVQKLVPGDGVEPPFPEPQSGVLAAERPQGYWCRWVDLNNRPSPYESAALPLSYTGIHQGGPLR